MPELPEVETTRRNIDPLLQGRRVARVETTEDSYLFITPVRELKKRLEGGRFLRLERVGKYLVAGLEDRSRLVIHLGMTGQFFGAGAQSVRLLSATARASLAPEEQREFRPDRHTHLVLRFDDDGPAVFLRDVRKFGKVMWLPEGARHPRLDRLGPDALTASGELLWRAGRKRAASVKGLLLDQAVLAGVGNIYADEALFLAGIRPGRAARRVSRSQYATIADSLRRVLERSIETGGASISDYVAPDGSDGRYQDERRVYARDGEPCLACGTGIRKKVVAQRGTHYCPACQI